MKKRITLLSVVVFGGLLIANAQPECGNVIELSGVGMQVDGTALASKTLYFSDISTIDSIIVEAIYKDSEAPTGFINFSSAVQSVDVSATALDYYISPAFLVPFYHPNVFRTTMLPAESITLNNNIARPNGIWSFAAYVFRSSDDNKISLYAGDHALYYRNGSENPGVQVISIPPAAGPRDIKIELGISELNNDHRIGYFNFIAGAYNYLHKIQSYDPALGISYIIEEVVLPAIPGDVTEIIISSVSPNQTNGDSYIGGLAVLTMDCTPEEDPKPLCTYTQGYYGNPGGKTCDGLTTTELLKSLLEVPLVVGGGANTLTLTKDDIPCIYTRLPGGGPAAALKGTATCSDPIGIRLHRKGSFMNTLLAQTVTLALNFRLSPDLAGVPLNTKFVTLKAQVCSDPSSPGIPGTEKAFYIPSSVVNYLGAGATVKDLLDLSNKALAGGNVKPLSLSEIADAADAINNGFGECRVLSDENSDKKAGLVSTAFSNENDVKASIYPNPVRNGSVVELSFARDNNAHVAIYDLSGREVEVLHNRNVIAEKVYNFSIPVEKLEQGIYMLRVITNDSSSSIRFNVVK